MATVEKYNRGVGSCGKPSRASYQKGCRCDACRKIFNEISRQAGIRYRRRKGVPPKVKDLPDNEWLVLCAKGKANLCPACAKKFTRLPSGFCKECEDKRTYG